MVAISLQELAQQDFLWRRTCLSMCATQPANWPHLCNSDRPQEGEAGQPTRRRSAAQTVRLLGATPASSMSCRACSATLELPECCAASRRLLYMGAVCALWGTSFLR